MKHGAIALLLCVLAAKVQAQELTGYAKNLAIRSNSLVDGSAYWLDISRVRLQGALERADWRAEVWGDLEFQAGSFFQRGDAAFIDGGDPALADLEHVFASGDLFRALGRIFRATVTNHGARSRLVIGRQRVAWGTGFVWTPTDLLNPLAPTSIERDEKGAVDAVNFSYETGAMSGVDVVASGGRDAFSEDADRSIAVRFRSNVGEYDLAVMAGRFRGRWAAGGDFAGYLGNAGLRGEFAVIEATGNPTLRAVLNADYTFRSGVYALLELHYNGPGALRRADYDRTALLNGELTGLARWYSAVVASYSLTPLTSASAYVLTNMVDGSGLLGPSISRSVSDNVDVAVGLYGFVGSDRSEFGSLGSVYFATLQFYF